MTNEEAVKMLRTMQRTVYLGNRKFEDAIECAIKALSEPLQPREVLVAQTVLPQPAEPKRGHWIEADVCGNTTSWECSCCHNWTGLPTGWNVKAKLWFCPKCTADMREVNNETN